MPRRADGKQRMIKAMGRLMQRQGFHATGLNQVVAESGTPKGSLYFHFPGGKEQLAAEAIQGSGERLQAMFEAALTGASSAEEAVRGLARGMAAGLARSSYADGCPIATVALEASATSDAIRAASQAAFSSWEAAIVARLKELGWPEDEARSFSVVVLAALEGGLLLSRAARDASPLHEVGEHLARLAAGRPGPRPDRPRDRADAGGR